MEGQRCKMMGWTSKIVGCKSRIRGVEEQGCRSSFGMEGQSSGVEEKDAEMREYSVRAGGHIPAPLCREMLSNT